MSTLDFEEKVGVPIESALTFAKLMDSWFAHVGLVPVPPGNPFLGINEDERRKIAFGFADLVARLAAIAEQVNGAGGICPR